MLETSTSKIKGRRMRPGRLSFDPVNGSIRIFVGYCEHGKKVLIDRDDITTLVKWARKDERSTAVRLLKRLLKARIVL